MLFLHPRLRTHRRGRLAGASLLAILCAGQTVYADEPPPPGSNADEVLVTGQRFSSSRSQEEQKDADTVSSFISADDMGRIPDATVAETLSHVPGVNILNDQETGQGQYVTVRALASTYNAFEINGNRVAETDNGGSRQVSLDVLPPNGLSGIKISKTLTPDMDGDAIAGTIDVRTPSAFDFDKPLLRLFYNHSLSDRAMKDHDPDQGNSGQADLAWKFGNGQRFGVYFSAYYSDNNIANEESENDGEWTPYQYQGNSNLPIQQNTNSLPGLDLDYRVIELKRAGGNLSFDYHGDNTNLYFRSLFTDYQRTETHNELVVKNQSIGACAYYTSCTPSGVYDPTAFYVNRNISIQDLHEDLGSFNTGGQIKLGALTIDYDTAFSFGEYNDPRSYSAAFQSSANAAPFNQTGVLFSVPDPRFPVWTLPAYAQSAVYDNSLLLPSGASLTKDSSTDKRFSARLDARYDLTPPAWLDEAFVKGGVKYSVSNRQYVHHDITESNFNTANLATSGLVTGSVGCFLGCVYQFGSIMGRQALISAINALGPTAPDGSPGDVGGADDENGNDTKNHEAVYAAYAMGDVKFRNVEVIAGLRTETTRNTNTFWVNDDPNSHWDLNHKNYTNILPSINVNYRPDPVEVYRAAVWTSFARPEFDYISGGSSVTRNAADQITAVTQGNPNLKSATALNVDTSAEWYFNKTSMFSIAPFYKRIKDYTITAGNDIQANNLQGFVEVTQVANGNPATVYGVEFGLAKDLRELSPPFDGFGVFGNLTRQNSETTSDQNFIVPLKIPLVFASKLSYNGGVSYNKYGFEAQLTYHWQGPYLMSLRV